MSFTQQLQRGEELRIECAASVFEFVTHGSVLRVQCSAGTHQSTTSAHQGKP